MSPRIVFLHGANNPTEVKALRARLEEAGVQIWSPVEGEIKAWIRREIKTRGLVVVVADAEGRVEYEWLDEASAARAEGGASVLVTGPVSVSPAALGQPWDLVWDYENDDLDALLEVLRRSRFAASAPPPMSPPPMAEYPRGAVDPVTLSAFTPLESRATWATAVVATVSIAAFLSLVVEILHLSLRQGAGQAATGADQLALWAKADAMEIVDGVLSLAYIPGIICGAVAFLMWMVKAYKNLSALGIRDVPYSPGYAAGSFFIPFVNLYVPYAAMSTLGRASQMYQGQSDGDSWKQNATPVLSIVWTITWLIANLLGQATTRMALREDGFDKLGINGGMPPSTVPGIINSALIVIAGIAISLYLWQITRWQRERYEKLSQENSGGASALPVTKKPVGALITGALASGAFLVFTALGVMRSYGESGNWVPLKIDGAGITVHLPEAVEPEASKQELFASRTWSSAAGNDEIFIAEYRMEEGSEFPEELAKEMVESMAKSTNEAAGAATETTLASLPGYELEVDVTAPELGKPEGSRAIYRGVVANGRLVIFAIVKSSGSTSEANQKMFFDSIRYAKG